MRNITNCFQTLLARAGLVQFIRLKSAMSGKWIWNLLATYKMEALFNLHREGQVAPLKPAGRECCKPRPEQLVGWSISGSLVHIAMSGKWIWNLLATYKMEAMWTKEPEMLQPTSCSGQGLQHSRPAGFKGATWPSRCAQLEQDCRLADWLRPALLILRVHGWNLPL